MDYLAQALLKAKKNIASVNRTSINQSDFTQTIQGPALKVAPVGVASIGYNYYNSNCDNTSFANNLIFNSPSRPCYNLQLVNDDSYNFIRWSFDGVSISGEVRVGEATNDLLIPRFTSVYLLAIQQSGGSTTAAFRLKVW